MQFGGKIKKKHLAIELVPRILWIIQFGLLYLICSNTEYKAQLTNSIFLMILGVILLLTGAFFSAYTFKILSKAMITKELIRKGPYKHVRHPMYLAMYLFLIGLGILFFSWIWFVVLLVFVPFWYITIRLEERQMQSLHPQKYQQYKKTSGMILPPLFNK